MGRSGLFGLALATFGCGGSRGSASIESVEPRPESTVDAASFVVEVELDRNVAMDALPRIAVRGRFSGPLAGVMERVASDRVRFTPGRAPAFGETVTVQVADTAEPSLEWRFWTRAAAGVLEQARRATLAVRAPGEDPIQSYGAHAGDLNGDGLQDLAVPNEQSDDVRVALNRGDDFSAFQAFAVPSGSQPSANEAVDLDGDGHLDFVTANIGGDSVTVFLGDGLGGFGPGQTVSVGQEPRGLCVVDLNGDLAPDLVTANRGSSDLSLLSNDGAGGFAVFATVEAGVEGETSCVEVDLDGDLRLDVVVGGFLSETVGVLSVTPDGSLALRSTQAAGGSAWMLAAGDIDGDGVGDVVSANARQDEVALLIGDGAARLRRPVTVPVSDFPLAVDVGDLDGDGDLDVVASHEASADWQLYENDAGSLRFATGWLATAAASCAVLHDRDGDGDVDVTGIDEAADEVVLFENR